MNHEPLRFEDLSYYEKTIVMDTNCTLEDAAKVEYVMRDHIFHAPLDSLSRTQFRHGAREALELLQAERSLFDNYFADVRRVFEEGRATSAQHKEENGV